MDRSSRLRRLGVLAVVAVLAAACGSGDRGANPDGGGGGQATTSAPAAAAFGDLPSPCGGGDAKGATDQGVTDTSITIAYGDDRGFTGSPGLSHEIGDAVKAMIGWCNEQGGINGREIVGDFYDAKITETNNVMTEACGSAFMLVGQGWAFDSTGEQTRVACNLVSVQTYSVSPEFANGPMQYQAVPNPADETVGAFFAQFAKLHPDKIKKAAQYTTTLATENYSTRRGVEAARPFGWEWLPCTQTVNYFGEPDYKPFMQKLKDCGAEVVWFTLSAGPQLYNALQAANQVDFHPIWLTETNNYVRGFAEFNSNGLADNVYVRTAYVPMEQADRVPAVKQYIEIVEADGGDTSQLGMQATSSFLLWATAAKKCGSTLTRQCMVNELSKVTEWTGGGLHAATNPGENHGPECGMLLRMKGTEYVQEFPEKVGEFDCSPSYTVKLPDDFVTVELTADRISTNYLTDKVIKPQA
ncbi:ABC transporter substrate-binding protein [Frankia sp. CNm7]|uniref:ABC transporter substrate-binding protein n=1 Tax=Frankia nepalensis TaxID=1836974 RepID=A0A937RMG3_9ACTN|nr:ABC transporter substrate-binding protein [Frankia nepalensis]MBL7496462.1 ABC transporter substrate-binding protein [Frankia nepalensis]MBL7510801.1 ABC transporter substrate-binding protein [Frankia nepalensis]MBL7521702.1 ABC transporter substrate-binding protein [Frankia nepalensis]MBL7631600.1 ABC transporter substrate-binding protein [Frankia nepalensis]